MTVVGHLGWDDWNLLGVEAMAVDPAHPDRVYLALGTYAQPWPPTARGCAPPTGAPPGPAPT